MKKDVVRYCIINSKAGDIYVRFSVDEDIMAGVEFRLYHKETQEALTYWKMAAGNGDTVSKQIRIAPEKLNHLILTWQVICCSQNVDTYEGNISIEVIQDRNICKMTIPASWYIDNIPPCAIKRSVEFSESFTFLCKD